MWRICRKTIFPRCHVNRQNPVDAKNQNNSCPKALILCPVTEKKRYSNHEDKQHAKDKRCWDDPHFQFNNCYYTALLETAGWVGTAAALCIDVHLKHFKNILKHDQRPHSACLFSRSVLAMPMRSISSKESTILNAPLPISLFPEEENNTQKNKVSTDIDIVKTIQTLSDEYVASVQNSTGVASLHKNDRKAFRYFQAAARLGSSQAFYNLGLCYEMGKGTRVNLQRAAFCYRKAAMRGHGLASFNLAVYFMKGMGGLPADGETARLLLAEAAKKGIHEAQLYLGIELLEEEKWLDAVEIFKSLAKENVPEGQYYLALCFENGWGVERNKRAAAQLFSKSASQGNKEASVKLLNYSEEKKSGCDSNSGFSVTLYQILRIQGRTNTGLASTETNHDVTEPAAKTLKKNCSIHVSASVPELAKGVEMLPKKCYASSYLDLMIPFFSVQNTFYKPKATFAIGEDTIFKDGPSSSVSIPLSSLSQVIT